MTCPNCAASISENEERCPYCDSYIDHGRHPKVEPPRNAQFVRSLGEDKVNPLLVVLSLIPMFGIILGAMFMSGGNQKSGKTYLIIGIVSFLAFPCFTFVLPVLFAILASVFSG